MLQHLRNAAGPETKLLIVDMVLPHACYDDWADGHEAIPGAERTLAPEGSPLLPNLGRASATGYQLDISVSTIPRRSSPSPLPPRARTFRAVR